MWNVSASYPQVVCKCAFPEPIGSELASSMSCSNGSNRSSTITWGSCFGLKWRRQKQSWSMCMELYIYIDEKKKTLERSGKHTLTPYKYWQSFHKSHSAGLVIGNHALQMGQNLLLQPCLHIEVFSLLCKNLLHLAAENLSSDRRMPSCHSCPLKFGSSWCAASEHPLDSPWRHQCSWDDQMLWDDKRMLE